MVIGSSNARADMRGLARNPGHSPAGASFCWPAADACFRLVSVPHRLEPYEDQWAYLSTLGRLTPAELRRAAEQPG